MFVAVAIPMVLLLFSVAAVLAAVVAGLTRWAPVRRLRAGLGAMALVGGVACLSATTVALDPNWIQPLGSLPLVPGSEFSQTFDVHHKGLFWVVLVEEDDPDRRAMTWAESRSRADAWQKTIVSWTVRTPAAQAATGSGRPLSRHSAYRDELTDLASFGSFEAEPGQGYEVSLRIFKLMPEVANERAVVEIRADLYVFKQAHAQATMLSLLAYVPIGAGIILLLLALIDRLRR